MIDAFIDGARDAVGRSLFRGRGLGFWIEHSFRFCRFHGTLPGAGCGAFLVFSQDLLPEMGEAGLSELRGWLRRGKQPANGVLAPAGNPFFIVSPSVLKEMGAGPGPGIFRKLNRLPRINELVLKHAVRALDPRREPLQVEAAVVALQVRHLRAAGVRAENLGNFFLEGLPAIGRGSLLGPGVVIKGDCRIGRNVTIEANCVIENSRIGDGCIILPGSIIRDSVIEREVQLGPYCHLRQGSLVRRGAKMGNFVEMKKSVLGRGSKAMHLSYIGDATVGKKVNIGAGTITCNYDGERKNPTRIGDDVFIGSGTELVAPVTIHSHSYVGAGSTITEDVPRHALAVARQRQRNITGWVLRKKTKKN